MSKTKNIIIIVFFILILLPIYNINILASLQDNPPTKIIDNLRGIDINFTPPKVIQDCGSQFNLTVNLNNKRNWPRFFSIVVFMKIPGEYLEHSIQRIGIKSFVYLPADDEITVQIPCLTFNNTLSNLKCLKNYESSEIEFIKGSIGVKISKWPLWIIEGLFWNYFIRQKLLLNTALLNIFRFSALRQIFSSAIRSIDLSINWNNSVKFIHPFICSDRIKLNNVKINTIYQNNTVNNTIYKNSKIYITINITNNLEENIILNTLVDMANEKYINDFFPTFPTEIYNLGHNLTVITANNNSEFTFDCTFPNQSFKRKEYQITIECAPYIPVENSNLFGIYFFDWRYKNLVSPIYQENETVQNLIKNVWYNTPIFNASKDVNSPLFFVYHDKIYYNDKTPTEELVEEIINIIEEYKFELAILIFLIIIPYGFFVGLINWIVRKKS